MKQVVVLAVLAACLTLPAVSGVAQTVSGQCFAIGDIAGQVASWRAHKKTRAQAVAQAAKYYQGNADRQAINAVIDRIYGMDGPVLTPDRASMLFTTECVNQQAATKQ